MEREEFLKKLSMGLITVCAFSGLQACSSKSTPSPTNNGGSNNTVNLSTSIPNIGDQVVIGSGNVLVFRIAAGNSSSSFVATEAICPHQGGSLSWINAKSYIQCNLHSSEYDNTGKILQQPVGGGTTRALKIYATSVSGTTLTVTVV